MINGSRLDKGIAATTMVLAAAMFIYHMLNTQVLFYSTIKHAIPT